MTLNTSRSCACLALIALIGASIVGCKKSKSINIDGSSTVVPITPAVAEDYRGIGQCVKIPISVSGTSGAMKKLINGELNICNASRHIKDVEKERCAEEGIEVIQFTIAFDGLSVVTNPNNNWYDSITLEELQTIWRHESKGLVQNWNEVNPYWPNEPLKLVAIETATYVNYLPYDLLNDNFSALPLQIFNWAAESKESIHKIATAGIVWSC